MQPSNLPVEMVPLLAKETETFWVIWHGNHTISMKALIFLMAEIPSFWSYSISVWADEFFIH